MIGILDAGGGMRDIYGCGIFDCLMDREIDIKYCLGVSAGSANIASYLARQRGRNLRFYTKYSTRREYMGWHAFFKAGSFFNLDYIYSYLADQDAEDPIDMKAMKENEARFVIAATDAATGKQAFFTKDDLHQNDMTAVKASCAIPVACRPVRIEGREYVDGGVSDPIPYEKAFADGCDKLIVILTRPLDFIMQPQARRPLYSSILRRYPAVVHDLDRHHSRYNKRVAELRKMETDGKVILLAPKDTLGVENTTRNPKMLMNLYNAGYADAEKKLQSVSR